MGDTVEILLDGPDALSRATSMLQRAAPVFWGRGQPLRLSVSSQEQPNTPKQKKFWNGPVLDAIANQARWDGKRFPKEFWKEYYRRKFLLRDEYVTPDGEIMNTYWSTADKGFSVRMMADFLDKVMFDAMTEWGVIFDA
jgi:hypothetical protein